ncbi:MAG: SDR family NAD(P)-dependent oxidoreductase [Spirochaetales bacterium]|nr:SDR family NAD(P)-dependent oxidoreductase [Spirochaetales bacterium]
MRKHSDMKDPFQTRYGPWALVAGASEGLGRAFAEGLAARGLHLVLIARRKKLLQSLTKELQTLYSIQVRTLALDLSNEDLIERLIAFTRDIEVGLVVYNAAFPNIGLFHRRSYEEHKKLVSINCLGPVALCYQFGKLMRQRGSGGIILMSSLTGFVGTPVLAHYAASKAYNRILAEGLWRELKPSGVAVLACCAGAVATPNFRKSIDDSVNISRIPVMRAEKVVRKTLRALGKKAVVVPGFLNKLHYFFIQRIISRKRAVSFLGRITERLYKTD